MKWPPFLRFFPRRLPLLQKLLAMLTINGEIQDNPAHPNLRRSRFESSISFPSLFLLGVSGL
jgi:hypothetical protein